MKHAVSISQLQEIVGVGLTRKQSPSFGTGKHPSMAVLSSPLHNSAQGMPMVGDRSLVRSDRRSTAGAGYTRKAEAEQDQVRNTC